MKKSALSNGLFITFEGTEGSGKSTLIRNLSKELIARGHSLCVTREPGGPQVAEAIREVLLRDFGNEKMAPLTELFLYESARAEHLEKVILPALKRGDTVLCDRFTDSSLAYQGHARGLDLKLIGTLNKLATHSISPKVTFLLDLDPAEGLKRASDPNRFEREGLAFHKKVREGFLKTAKKEFKRFHILSVSKKTPAQLCSEVMNHLEKRKYVARLG